MIKHIHSTTKAHTSIIYTIGDIHTHDHNETDISFERSFETSKKKNLKTSSKSKIGLYTLAYSIKHANQNFK